MREETSNIPQNMYITNSDKQYEINIQATIRMHAIPGRKPHLGARNDGLSSN